MWKYLLFAAGALLLLLAAGCASPDENAVRQVVVQSETAADNALNGKGTLTAVEQYFATPLESGNTDTQIVDRIAYSGLVGHYPGGTVRLSKFKVDSIALFPEVNEARVQYEIDVTIVRNMVPQTETVTQDLLLVKTASRGWRIAASNGAETSTGDVSFLGNLGGQ